MNHVITIETGYINLSPFAFRRTAEDFVAAYESFKPPSFSIVPFFLCCRAIELALKSIHLESRRQIEVKRAYSHKLYKAYRGLPQDKQVLSNDEVTLLKKTSERYDEKRFEYLQPIDAAHAYKDFPDASILAAMARKLIAASADD